MQNVQEATAQVLERPDTDPSLSQINTTALMGLGASSGLLLAACGGGAGSGLSTGNATSAPVAPITDAQASRLLAQPAQKWRRCSHQVMQLGLMRRLRCRNPRRVGVGLRRIVLMLQQIFLLKMALIPSPGTNSSPRQIPCVSGSPMLWRKSS